MKSRSGILVCLDRRGGRVRRPRPRFPSRNETPRPRLRWFRDLRGSRRTRSWPPRRPSGTWSTRSWRRPTSTRQGALAKAVSNIEAGKDARAQIEALAGAGRPARKRGRCLRRRDPQAARRGRTSPQRQGRGAGSLRRGLRDRDPGSEEAVPRQRGSDRQAGRQARRWRAEGRVEQGRRSSSRNCMRRAELGRSGTRSRLRRFWH